MGEINHQRSEGVPRCAGVVRGTDNGRQKTEIMVMTSLWAEETIYDYSITLANLSR